MEYTEVLAEPGVNELRSRRGTLALDEINILRAQYGKLKKGTSYLRFTVTQEMAKEIKAKGAVKLAVNLTGRDLAPLKEINVRPTISWA
ncbi:MAG: hypothetical protein M1379_12105 [Firmicutes bacterium]|nr:hypothetical protein [Bacillota bacterium]